MTLKRAVVEAPSAKPTAPGEPACVVTVQGALGVGVGEGVPVGVVVPVGAGAGGEEGEGVLEGEAPMLLERLGVGVGERLGHTRARIVLENESAMYKTPEGEDVRPWGPRNPAAKAAPFTPENSPDPATLYTEPVTTFTPRMRLLPASASRREPGEKKLSQVK